jgi:hypothetical protein
VIAIIGGGRIIHFSVKSCLFISHLLVEKAPGVWIYASAWELDHNLNDAAAPALMQNEWSEPLRLCPRSKDLWV